MSAFLYWPELQRSAELKIIRSKRKSVEMIITPYSEVIVKAPKDAPDERIRRFIAERIEFIKDSITRGRMSYRPRADELNGEQIAELKRRAKEYLPPRVSHFCELMGFSSGSVVVTSAKKHWGNCEVTKGEAKLCLPYRIMRLPNDLIDFIIVSILARIIEKVYHVDRSEVVSKYVSNKIMKEQELAQYAELIDGKNNY